MPHSHRLLALALFGLTLLPVHSDAAPGRVRATQPKRPASHWQSHNDPHKLYSVLDGSASLERISHDWQGTLKVDGRAPKDIAYPYLANNHLVGRQITQNAVRRVKRSTPATATMTQVANWKGIHGSNTISMRTATVLNLSNRKIERPHEGPRYQIRLVANAPVGSKVKVGNTTFVVDKTDRRMKPDRIKIESRNVVDSGHNSINQVLSTRSKILSGARVFPKKS